jgi:hypothetical protein
MSSLRNLLFFIGLTPLNDESVKFLQCKTEKKCLNRFCHEGHIDGNRQMIEKILFYFE